MLNLRLLLLALSIICLVDGKTDSAIEAKQENQNVIYNGNSDMDKIQVFELQRKKPSKRCKKLNKKTCLKKCRVCTKNKACKKCCKHCQGVPSTSPPPLITCKVVAPGPNTGKDCIFPFIWNATGKTYNECAFEPERGDTYAWCSTKVDARRNHVNGGGHWGKCDPKTCQGLDSIFEQLWSGKETIALRTKVVNSYLIRNLISGELDPRLFTKFIINDLYYLTRVGDHYTKAIDNIGQNGETLLEALKERLKSANNFADFSYKYWGIVPDYGKIFVEPVEKSEIKKYVKYQSTISNTENPYFTLVVNLPCSYLWCWLGFYMQQQANCINQNTKNIYCKSMADIFSSNKNNINECSTKLIGYINTLGKDKDFDKIEEIFVKAMQFELDNFLWINEDLA